MGFGISKRLSIYHKNIMARTISSLNGTSVFSTSVQLPTTYIVNTIYLMLSLYLWTEGYIAPSPATKAKDIFFVFLSHRRTTVRQKDDIPTTFNFQTAKNSRF